LNKLILFFFFFFFLIFKSFLFLYIIFFYDNILNLNNHWYYYILEKFKWDESCIKYYELGRHMINLIKSFGDCLDGLLEDKIRNELYKKQLRDTYISIIDREDIDEIKNLSNNNSKIDIIFELYNNNLLTFERFQFIVNSCTKYLNISSKLITTLIKDENTILLDIIFSNLKFYENEFILRLLLHYKNKTAISISDFNKQISNEKFKILTNTEYSYNDSGKYLINECNKKDINIYIIKYLIEHGADINKGNWEGETPLLYTCYNKNEIFAKKFIEYLSDINKNDFISLFETFSSKNEVVIKYLIKHGADINKRNWYGETPLFRACSSGNEAIVKYLVKHGAYINKKSKKGETPLFKVCSNNNEALLKYLIEHKADINENIWANLNPILYAYEKKNEVIVKYLVELGANINEEDNNGYTPLFEACRNRNEKTIKYLIEHGADISKVNENGETLLFDVCNKSFLNYLSKYRYDIKDNNYTLLFEASLRRNKAVLKYLVEQGIDINKTNNDGNTVLFEVCSRGNEALIKYLVELGADINIKNINGNTVLFEACANGNEELVKYLVEFGADINIINNSGKTLLCKAYSSGNEALVKYLLEHGANEVFPSLYYSENGIRYKFVGNYICVMSYKAEDDRYIDIENGDIVSIYNFEGLYALGFNYRTKRIGIFPLYNIDSLNGLSLFYRILENTEDASENDIVFIVSNYDNGKLLGYNITKREAGFFNRNQLEILLFDNNKNPIIQNNSN